MAERSTASPHRPSAASDSWRDDRALARLGMFLLSAVAAVLVVRTLLAVAGYPQVGGGGLHVAHVLWGGLLMGVAIVLMEIFPGTLVRIRAAFVGGIGFGLFIDEVGKFVTKDVNYFFKPAIAIMYAVFVGFYLGVRELLQRRPLNDRRRLALASAALSDLALGQLDTAHRDYALRLLEGVDDTSGLRQAAQAVRQGLTAQRPDDRNLETLLSKFRDRLTGPLDTVLSGTAAELMVLVASGLVAADLALSVVIAITHPGKATALPTVFDTGLPALLSAVLLVIGVVGLLGGRRESGVRWLQRAVLVQLLVIQVVLFNRTQWLGLVGFALDVAVLWLLSMVLASRAHHPDGRESGGEPPGHQRLPWVAHEHGKDRRAGRAE
ncbi:MAG: hypothetical protein ACR2N4_19560 [Jatrophihabitans sp.]